MSSETPVSPSTSWILFLPISLSYTLCSCFWPEKWLHSLVSVLDDLKEAIASLVEQFNESHIPLPENASVSRVCYIIERILQTGLKGTFISMLWEHLWVHLCWLLFKRTTPIFFLKLVPKYDPLTLALFSCIDIAIFGTTSVWDYLIEIRDSIPGGDKLVDNIKNLQKTDMGRARALIRYAAVFERVFSNSMLFQATSSPQNHSSFCAFALLLILQLSSLTSYFYLILRTVSVSMNNLLAKSLKLSSGIDNWRLNIIRPPPCSLMKSTRRCSSCCLKTWKRSTLRFGLMIHWLVTFTIGISWLDLRCHFQRL